jgi:hypothetical protein
VEKPSRIEWAEVSRQVSRMKIVGHIVEGIVFTASHFSPLAPFEGNRGDSINTAVPNHWDRVSAQFNGFGCRLEKI